MNKKKFVVKSIIENVFVNRYSLYYRDCIKILKFFIKHEFFANNLIYTFIRKCQKPCLTRRITNNKTKIFDLKSKYVQKIEMFEIDCASNSDHVNFHKNFR